MRKSRRCGMLGMMFAMLGAGLILAFAFPSKFLVILLSIALIISGIALCKNG